MTYFLQKNAIHLFKFLKCSSNQTLKKLSNVKKQTKTNTTRAWKVEMACKVFVTSVNVDLNFFGNPTSSNEVTLTSNDSDITYCQYDFNPMANTLEITSINPKEQTDVLNVSIPVTGNISANTTSCALNINNLENDFISVISQNGRILLNNIKSTNVALKSNGGDVISKKLLHGDCTINCKNGFIKCDKLIGNEISLETEGTCSDLTTGDVYGEDIFITAKHGNIMAKSLHGCSEVTTITGKINIDTAQGRLDATSDEGHVNVYFPMETESFISTNKGDVCLKFSESAGAKLDIECKTCDDSNKDLQLANQHSENRGPCVRYKAELNEGKKIIAPNGNVTLQCQSWFDLVNLKH